MMSKKPEILMWSKLRRIMGGSWLATRHEDRLNLGVPDVSYTIKNTNGWIEMKQIEKWPAKSTTPIKIKHFTAQQRQFLRTRANCFLLLWVRSENIWLLFIGKSITPEFGVSLNRNQIEDTAALITQHPNNFTITNVINPS